MIRNGFEGLSLRSKMFLAFGLLILLSTAVIAAFSYSLAASELDAYALQTIDRNIQFVSSEVEAQLRATQAQGILLRSDKTVREALDGYSGKTPLEQWESWSALNNTFNMWTATRQLSEIRLHLKENLLFLRDGQRFISGTDRPEALKEEQGEGNAYWDLFSREGFYSCFTPLTAGWSRAGYVEIQADASPILTALDTKMQTGMSLYLTDGREFLDAGGKSAAYEMGLTLPEGEKSLSHIHETVNGIKMLYTVLKIADSPLYLIGEMPAALVSQAGMGTLSSILFLLAGVLALAFLLAYFISRYICLRLEKLKSAMALVQGGRLDVKVEEAGQDEMGQILHAFNHMAADLKTTTETALRNQRIGKETELRLMQAQINPHFIYNTLESISWAAAGHDTAHVEYLVRNLSDFLRSSLSKTRQLSTVAGEIKSIQSYWNIQDYRFGGRIKLRVEAEPAAMDVKVLPMLLQPLVENALLHGILPQKEREGSVTVRAELAEDLLILEVEDDGLGIPPEELSQLQRLIESQSEGSYGLWNVHQRVRTQYGEEFGLSVQSAPGEGTLCILTLPAAEKQTGKTETQ